MHIPWRTLLPHRQTWAFVLGKFLTDPVWWLYLFWIPDFLNRNHGIDLRLVGPPLVAIYLIADVGSIGGGWLSSALIKRGWSVNAGRKTAMLVCALAVLPMVFASGARDLWVAVGARSASPPPRIRAGRRISSRSRPTCSRGRRSARSSASAGMAGAVGGMLIAKLTGYILQATGSYVPVFLMAAFAYLTALGVIHLLVPRLEPVRLK